MSAKNIVMAAAGSQRSVSYVGGRSQAILGTTSSTNISLTSLTGGGGSAPAAGDLVVAFFGVGHNFSSPTLSITGYTELVNLTANDNNDANLLVAYKVMSGTPDTILTIPNGTSSANNAGAIVIHVFRNAGSVSLSGTQNLVNSLLADPPSATASLGSVIVAGAAGAHTAGVATYSSSDLSSFLTVGSDDTADVSVAAGLKTGLGPGASFNPAAFTFSAADDTTYSAIAATLVVALAA